MKYPMSIIIYAALGFASLADASSNSLSLTCEELQNESVPVQVLRSGNILNGENWNTIDVVFSFDPNHCLASVSQELLKLEGQFYWRFRTTQDQCDGGNVYGVIYTYDLKTPIAHIYDGDIYCKSDWRAERISPKL